MKNNTAAIIPLPSIRFIYIVLVVLCLSTCAMMVFAHTVDLFSALNNPGLLLRPYVWFWLCAVLVFAGAFVLIGAVLPTLISALFFVARRIWLRYRPYVATSQFETYKDYREGAQNEQTINNSRTPLCDGTTPIIDEAKFSALFKDSWTQYPLFLKKVKEEYPKFVKRDFGKLALELTESECQPINDSFLDTSNKINFKAFNDAFHDAFGITPSSQRPNYYNAGRVSIGFKFKDYLQK